MNSFFRNPTLVLASLLFGACGADPAGTTDAGVDLGSEAAVDAQIDAHADATVDAQMDANAVDATVDAQMDAMADGAADATVDATATDSEIDAAVDAAVDAGPICGTPSLDQRLGECSTPPIAQCTSAFITLEGQLAAQTFSPERSGQLSSVRLEGSNPLIGSGVNAELLVVSTSGGGEDAILAEGFDVAANTLASGIVPFTDASGWAEVTFADPPLVTAGETYYLLLRTTGPDLITTCVSPYCELSDGDCSCSNVLWSIYNDYVAETDSYIRGAAYSKGASSTWLKEPSYRDYVFETYVAECE